MLAYGRSKRTLRFSSHSSSLPLSLAAPVQPSSTPDLPGAEGSESTPDLLLSPAPRRSPPPAARHSPSSPCFRAGAAVFPSHLRTGLQGREYSPGGTMNSGGGGGSGMRGHQQGSDDRAPARQRFRLDMDLGSDSDSSCDRDDDHSAHRPSFANRNEFTNSLPQAAHGNHGSDVAFGSSGARPPQRGSVAPGSLGLGQNRRHETPMRNSRQEQWQAAGGAGDRAWSQPDSSSYSSIRGGAGRGAAGQYLDDDRRESLSFVTPDHAGKSTLVLDTSS